MALLAGGCGSEDPEIFWDGPIPFYEGEDRTMYEDGPHDTITIAGRIVIVHVYLPEWREALALVDGPVYISGIDIITRDAERRAEVLRIARRYGIGVSVSPEAGSSFLRDVPNIRGLALARGAENDFAGISDMSELRSVMVEVGRANDYGDEVDEATRIGDEVLEHFRGLTQLRYLRFDRAAITGSGLVHLREMSELRSLRIDYSPLSEGLEHLGGLRNLEELYLGNTELADEDVAHLSSLESLETLDLRSTAVTDASMPTIGQLTTLRHLDLSGNEVTDAGLPPLLALPNLEYISLGRTLVTDYGEMMFRDDVEVSR